MNQSNAVNSTSIKLAISMSSSSSFSSSSSSPSSSSSTLPPCSSCSSKQVPAAPLDQHHKSSFRGVHCHGRRWRASITIGCKNVKLGVFDNIEEAARCYDQAARKHQMYPILNYLPSGELNPDRKKKTNNQKGESSKALGPKRVKKRGTASMYKGVTWRKDIGKWFANICINGKMQYLGYHDDEDQAARCYDEAALKYFEQPVLNFSEETGKINAQRHLLANQGLRAQYVKKKKMNGQREEKEDEEHLMVADDDEGHQ